MLITARTGIFIRQHKTASHHENHHLMALLIFIISEIHKFGQRKMLKGVESICVRVDSAFDMMYN